MVFSHNRGGNGFSLVELMIVIVIIGVLVGAAVPIYQHNLEVAKRAEAVAGIGTVRTQLRMYYGITGSYPIRDSFTKVVGDDWNDINKGELTIKYFKDKNFKYRSYDGIAYRIKCQKNRVLSHQIWIDQTGRWWFDIDIMDDD
ncbi:MAG: prepilin-type N-terminal cleavage/methylation domain-containing protein [Candidatus Marinimicrobia bacterium]|nr:prepilin-type N-terminal cleavage/methylation domain-containing protein [Candidatus Neomarinimicrobiota bacterium]